jgi:hypothetical protein
MRHDTDEAVSVAGVWRENNAAPELVDPDRSDPVVLTVGELLQVEPGVDVFGELVDRGLHAALHLLGQLRVVVKEVLVDREPRHVKRLLPGFPTVTAG